MAVSCASLVADRQRRKALRRKVETSAALRVTVGRMARIAAEKRTTEIGRASCRERVS